MRNVSRNGKRKTAKPKTIQGAEDNPAAPSSRTLKEKQKMNLTPEFINEVRATAKAYDGEADATKRAELGSRLDSLAERLSDGQVKQVIKIISR